MPAAPLLRTCLLVAVLASAAPAFATDAGPSQKALPDERVMIDERFDVAAATRLLARLEDADLVVEQGAAGSARIEVILRADDLDAALDYYERQRIRVRGSREAVEVTSDPVPRRGLRWNDRNRIAILVRATVPDAMVADLRTVDGDVRVEALTGAVRIETVDGDLAAGHLGGPVFVHTVDGDITVERLGATAGDVAVRTTDGDVSVERIDAAGAAVAVRTTDGDIVLGTVQGRTVDVRTVDGDLRLDRLAGASIDLQASDGEIEVGEIVADRARVRTEDGGIALRAVDAALDASSAEGDLDVRLLKAAPTRLRTEDGDILITAPARLAADLDLHGDDVEVDRAFDVRGTRTDERASGTLNGGGPRLEARTNDGSVVVRADR